VTEQWGKEITGSDAAAPLGGRLAAGN